MSLVNIINVEVLDNPTSFSNPLQFDITFECIQQLEEGKVYSDENLILIEAIHNNIFAFFRFGMEGNLCRLC